MNKFYILLFFTVGIYFNSYSQAVGEWQTYFSYSSVSQVEESSNKIFALGNGSLFSCAKDGTGIETYSRVNGLSDSDIAHIKYSSGKKLLFIVYQNANIDILMDDGIVNIPDIMNKTMTGDKTIYGISFEGDYAYLATGIGVVVVNLDRYEIKETYTIKKDDIVSPVYGVAVSADEIFASTSTGTYKGNRSDNLLDSSKWQVTGKTGRQIAYLNGSHYLVASNDGLYKYENASWKKILDNKSIQNLTFSDNEVIVTTPTKLYVYDSNAEKTEVGGFSSALSSIYSKENNAYWIAAGNNGLLCIKDGSVLYSNIKPDGPAVKSVYDQKIVGDRLILIDGAVRDLTHSPVVVFDLKTNKWKLIDKTIQHATCLAVNPKDNTHFFVSSAAGGVYEFRNDEFYTQHTYLSSGGVLETVNMIPTNWLWISALAFSPTNNNELWMCNGHAPNSIKILNTNDATWKKYGNASMIQIEGHRMFFPQNSSHKWLICAAYGVYVFDETSSNNIKHFKTFTDQDGIAVSDATRYYSIVQDKNNAIWIGTNRGILVFNNLSNVFNDNFRCSRIKIPRNDGSGLADYLLDSEQINTIAIDGGNRKWLGTESSGLYLVSEDGLETIHHFTIENSSLPSNKIRSLVIDPNTGVVFIGTDKGLVSFKSDAIEGKSDYSNVYVYPNPVRPDYSGLITVTGLMEKTQVRITDATGNLVHEALSQGGQLSWNGRNRSGEKVSTGVYLVFVTDNDGSQSMVTKIMVVR